MDSKQFITLALKEDIGNGDHTSLSCIPPKKIGSAIIICKEDGVIAGVKYIREVFKQLDESMHMEILASDGDFVRNEQIIAEISGNGIALLSGERLALNIIQRMSGIATHTYKMAKIIHRYNAKLLDTRKTTPLFRSFEKEAVAIGGGKNHRFGLYDMILIKENHIALAGGISQAIHKAKSYTTTKNIPLKIEIETQNLDELRQVLEDGRADRVMLDNFSIANLEKAVKMVNGKMETEASGGITEKTIEKVAATGVDYISSGALTHSYKSLDFSMLINL